MTRPARPSGPQPPVVWLLLAVPVLLAGLTGCSADELPAEPAESRRPAAGTGSEDPDDLNGDGHRDLLVPVYVGGQGDDDPTGRRIGVVYGSADGPDPVTRTVHDGIELGLPAVAGESIAPSQVLTADLDDDGFPEFVTEVSEQRGTAGEPGAFRRVVPYVTWGGPRGPGAEEGGATPVRLPRSVAEEGLRSLVRGDFDGDGRHDLAAFAADESSLVVLYGPFARSGEPARKDTDLPWSEGYLVADEPGTSGAPRATSLLVRGMSDGEQAGNTLHRARRGTGLSRDGEELRPGNAHAFGDFDGDGLRDVAVGDSGSRNDEPGYRTEAPEVAGSLAVYPGSGEAPVTHTLPEVPEGRATDYGPGAFFAADPDGDGRDGILVATYRGATLIDGDRRVEVARDPAPATDEGGERTPEEYLHARPAGAADFDADGDDELVLHWGPGLSFGLYGEYPTHWWITEGTGSDDVTSFATTSFAADGAARGAADGTRSGALR
ncbi:hypothetical protein RM572_03025 [Streptomyces sp. DSM 42041]|uniref:VCBS repeat-containing protein n=1 Tax=Streptomyces hazeniae TaxID=3075538 RepID=A0ABU2NP04_9ACTN|nr:hypothetical protein [Streptomyces sp. DSM 42041]MDT0377747.1 hypothetical protein [Streptomyces sp. DSM 42041]